MLIWFLFAAIACICFFQMYYLARSFHVVIRHDPLSILPAVQTGRLSILIPVFNSESTLGRCLASILDNDPAYIADVVVVLDRCQDGSQAIALAHVERFAARGIPLRVLTLPSGSAGKVAALLHGGRNIVARNALLLDSDIVLEPTCIAELATFHHQSRAIYSSCLIFPFQEPAAERTLTTHFICNNRLYRQSVIQAVKNLSGVGNFPGGLQLVDFHKYAELLADGFLEDLTATYRVLKLGDTIAIVPRVLAYEVERQSINGLFWQRVRWTLGAIQHLPTQVLTASTRSSWHQKILINSYHVMWEFQHYVIALGTVAALFLPEFRLFLLAPLLLYVAHIMRSVHLGRRHYENSLPGAAFHCIGFSFVITTALLGSLVLLLIERRFWFDTSLLFRRN